MNAGRELDALIAEKVVGFHVETIKPDWYPVPVKLFFRPDSPLIAYTYDERSCNAMMYRNGKDDTDGTADVLPSYSEDIAAAWEVVEQMASCHPVLERFTLPDRWRCAMQLNADTISSVAEYAETAPLAICLAALRAVGASPEGTTPQRSDP